jgi:hypothetical protein
MGRSAWTNGGTKSNRGRNVQTSNAQGANGIEAEALSCGLGHLGIVNWSFHADGLLVLPAAFRYHFGRK